MGETIVVVDDTFSSRGVICVKCLLTLKLAASPRKAVPSVKPKAPEVVFSTDQPSTFLPLTEAVSDACFKDL